MPKRKAKTKPHKVSGYRKGGATVKAYIRGKTWVPGHWRKLK